MRKEYEPMVSIIIPIYNVVNYIDQCIESVCKQSYSQFEIILVDDGSNDGSAEKCDEWGKYDNRIHIIHKINGGLSSARNAGLDIAIGKYVLFLDGDDYIDSNLLREVVPYMENGYEMVAFNYRKFFENGYMQKAPNFEEGIFTYEKFGEKKQFFIQKLLRYKIGWEACTRIFNREIIDNYSLRFIDNKTIFAEDLHFSLCYCAHCSKIYSLSKSLYFYRQHENSIMAHEKSNINVSKMDKLGRTLLNYYLQYDDCKELIDIFPVIYFMVINNVIERYRQNLQTDLKELRESIYVDLENPDFFIKQIKALKEYEEDLRLVYSNIQSKVILNEAKYFIDGKYLCAWFRYQLIRIYVKILPIMNC